MICYAKHYTMLHNVKGKQCLSNLYSVIHFAKCNIMEDKKLSKVLRVYVAAKGIGGMRDSTLFFL